MAGPLKKYAFINAKLRARISKILPEEFLNQLIQARSLLESIQLLKETPYSIVEAVYTRTGDLKLGELELFSKEVELLVEIEKYVAGEVLDFIIALVTRYEVESLKDALRLWFDRTFRERNIDDTAGYLFRKKIKYDLKVDTLINLTSLEEIGELLNATPYAAIVAQKADRVKSLNSLFPVEIELDRYFYKQLLEQAELLSARDRAIAERMIGVEIDMQNINWIIRFKKFYNLSLKDTMEFIFPRGHFLDRSTIEQAFESQNVMELLSGLVQKKYAGLKLMLNVQSTEHYSRLILIERVLEQIMLYEVRHALAGYPFTIGIILAYFILKQNEIKSIMTILNAKYYNMEEDRIKSRL
ncbi:MAG: V-type ATPase subunit [Spirochaetota bacterium]